MKRLAEGIAVFDDMFIRNEELINQADTSPNWRKGTAGPEVNPEIRITDIHEIDQKSELHKEVLDTFLVAINKYGERYPQLRIAKGEALRVARYQTGGHYQQHIDSAGPSRILSGILYLNSDFDGGELYFPIQDITIKPEPGKLVLFPSNFIYIHQSKEITKGTKYATVAWFS